MKAKPVSHRNLVMGLKGFERWASPAYLDDLSSFRWEIPARYLQRQLTIFRKMDHVNNETGRQFPAGLFGDYNPPVARGIMIVSYS